MAKTKRYQPITRDEVEQDFEQFEALQSRTSVDAFNYAIPLITGDGDQRLAMLEVTKDPNGRWNILLQEILQRDSRPNDGEWPFEMSRQDTPITDSLDQKWIGFGATKPPAGEAAIGSNLISSGPVPERWWNAVWDHHHAQESDTFRNILALWGQDKYDGTCHIISMLDINRSKSDGYIGITGARTRHQISRHEAIDAVVGKINEWRARLNDAYTKEFIPIDESTLTLMEHIRKRIMKSSQRRLHDDDDEESDQTGTTGHTESDIGNRVGEDSDRPEIISAGALDIKYKFLQIFEQLELILQSAKSFM